MPTSRQSRFDLFARPEKPRVLSVSEITRQVKKQLEVRFGRVWVSGEISGSRRQGSGHVYLTLKDEDASLQAVCFRGQARKLRFDLKDGMEVLAAGRLSVYAPRGQYQLIIDHLEPKGLGALQAAFEDLKKKLAKEGLFDRQRKKPLPSLPRAIGVVTSPTGAAVRDLLRVLRRRDPHVSVLIAPARVQGDGAASEVAGQLARLDSRGDLDLLVVTRGGGSIEDLWAFNEEEVARAVAGCRTPVVSAVGHEVDMTISDMVADLRAPTPSAAAEMIVPERRKLLRELEVLSGRLSRAARVAVDRKRSALTGEWRRAPDPRRRLTDLRLSLEGSRERLESGISSAARRRQSSLSEIKERLEREHPRARLHRLRVGMASLERGLADAAAAYLRRERRRLAALIEASHEGHPRQRLEAERARVERLAMRLSSAVASELGRARQVHAGLAGKLDALSPLRVLDRGYSLVRTAAGEVVRSSGQVVEGDCLDIRLARGRIMARVTGEKPPLEDDEGSAG